jgi:hypothetical protein
VLGQQINAKPSRQMAVAWRSPSTDKTLSAMAEHAAAVAKSALMQSSAQSPGPFPSLLAAI